MEVLPKDVDLKISETKSASMLVFAFFFLKYLIAEN